jgi:hypothetical protein
MNVNRLVVAAVAALLVVVGVAAARSTDESSSGAPDGGEHPTDDGGDERGPTAALTALVPDHVWTSLEIAVSLLSRGLDGILGDLGLARTESEADGQRVIDDGDTDERTNGTGERTNGTGETKVTVTPRRG